MELRLPNSQWLLYVPSGITFKILPSAHTVYLLVSYGSYNKELSFPYTAVIAWSCNRERWCLLRGKHQIFKYVLGVFFFCLIV
jgi:hypothetical protein